MSASHRASLSDSGDGMTHIVTKIGLMFQHVHKSAAHAHRARKDLLTMMTNLKNAGNENNTTSETNLNNNINNNYTNPNSESVNMKKEEEDGNAGNVVFVHGVCAILILILQQTPRISSDAFKRHYSFLIDMCKQYREIFNEDRLSCEIMKVVKPFHNAHDKSIRLAVVMTIEVVLKTVDQSDSSESRQDLYQELAELLKVRVHDKWSMIRQHAIAAVSAFQTGKKECDVTQQLMALLCTDTNAEVRKTILHCIAPRKEFLEGYFHGMMRGVRDVVARVRSSAWDALSRFPWRYIIAYAQAKKTPWVEFIAAGLQDRNSSVVIACRAAMTNNWLHRDCKENCTSLLDPLLVLCSSTPMHMTCLNTIADELFNFMKRKHPSIKFTLDLNDIHTSALLMWRANCRVVCDAENDTLMINSTRKINTTTITTITNTNNIHVAENNIGEKKEGGGGGANEEEEDVSQLLLPLPLFINVLQDTIYAYAKPDAPSKTVKFRTTDDADNMLRILLDFFTLYDENAYLVHADNTTRASLLRLLNFLLKVVPDEEPSLFVDVAIRAIKSLCTRTLDEATKTVTAALDSLFKSLKLPQRYGLGYDDVEALARMNRERQQDLIRLQVLARSSSSSSSSSSSTSTSEHIEQLQEEIDRDEKFLLRMQLIVLAYLSHSHRNEEIPIFCSHVIQLGRHLDDEQVKVAATKSLCLQCLINPDSVHTFMPLLISDACEPVRPYNASSALPSHLNNNNTNNNYSSLLPPPPTSSYKPEIQECVSITAVGVVFDLLMEYGFRFFDIKPRHLLPPPPPSHGNTTTTNNNNQNETAINNFTTNSELAARLQHEQELAEEDTHKIGAANLLKTLLFFLTPSQQAKNGIALIGFCKLLSCNRVPQEHMIHVLSLLSLHYECTYQLRKLNPTQEYLFELLNKFFRSFAASHARRQLFCAMSAMTAFRFLFRIASHLLNTAESTTTTIINRNTIKMFNFTKLLQQFNNTNNNNEQCMLPMVWALKLMEFTCRFSDAFLLTHIRDIDPETVKRVNAEVDNAIIHNSSNGEGVHANSNNIHDVDHNDNSSGNDYLNTRDGSVSRQRSFRSNMTRSSMQSGRLLRELSRYSLHEWLAQELLIEMTLHAPQEEECSLNNNTLEKVELCVPLWLVCLEVLEKNMYFYSKEPQPFLLYCGHRALHSLQTNIHSNDGTIINTNNNTNGRRKEVHETLLQLQHRLSDWLDDAEIRLSSSSGVDHANYDIRSDNLFVPTETNNNDINNINKDSNNNNATLLSSLEIKYNECVKERNKHQAVLNVKDFVALFENNIHSNNNNNNNNNNNTNTISSGMRREANNKSLRNRVKDEKRNSVKRERTDDDYDEYERNQHGNHSSSNINNNNSNNYNSNDNDFFDVESIVRASHRVRE